MTILAKSMKYLNFKFLKDWLSCHPSYDNEKFPEIVLPNSRHVSSIKQEGWRISTSKKVASSSDSDFPYH